MNDLRLDDARLIGTWQSDADATITERKITHPVTERQEQGLRKLFGKLKNTYTSTTITTEFNGKVDVQPYEIISKDRDSVTIKYWSDIANGEQLEQIRFAGSDMYWVEQFDVSECFRRVK